MNPAEGKFDLVPVRMSCGHTGTIKRWERDAHYTPGSRNLCPVCGMSGTVEQP